MNGVILTAFARSRAFSQQRKGDERFDGDILWPQEIGGQSQEAHPPCSPPTTEYVRIQYVHGDIRAFFENYAGHCREIAGHKKAPS